MGGVKAILMSQRSVNPWWILESAAEKKVGIQKSFRRVIQALEEIDRFVKESMPDDSQLNAEYNRAEKRASKLHEKLQDACNDLSDSVSSPDQSISFEFYDFISDFVEEARNNEKARDRATEMKERLSSRGIVTQQTNISADHLKSQLPTFNGESSLSILDAIDTWKSIFKNAGAHRKMWGSWILERIKKPASSSISPTTRRDQSFDDICKELRSAYGGAIEVGHNIMETHLTIGKIPDPSNHPEAALKALTAHHECMEHASRFIDLSSDESAEAEIMTGTYLKKILSFLPLRIRQNDDEFDKALNL